MVLCIAGLACVPLDRIASRLLASTHSFTHPTPTLSNLEGPVLTHDPSNSSFNSKEHIPMTSVA
jgi:hypothetical protein